ncbi:unnamed protein product [Caenorhabditis angaria]|uniref:Uncharacterized protein n=1 Tax=Caenorhabditis angaria TaxID=860376 RepID=A0A9P1MU81_9PELO|nr:unnamed protein product [Caenorhabditis angaria]
MEKNSAPQQVDEIILLVPQLAYRERSVDEVFLPENHLCPNSTPVRSLTLRRNSEMHRRFEKNRHREDKLLRTPPDDVFDEDDCLDQMRAFEPILKKHHREEDRRESLATRQMNKSRKHRRRRTGSFTGGVYPRKGHRNRSLLGYAIPPPNVHSNDWREMLAITDSKDDKLLKSLGVANCLGASKGDVATSHVTTSSDQTTILQQPAGCAISVAAVTASSQQIQLPTLLFNQMRFGSESNMSLHKNNWIRDTFTRRECSSFIASNRDINKCGCGRPRDLHRKIPDLTSEYLRQKKSMAAFEQSRVFVQDDSKIGTKAKRSNIATEKWSLRRHTVILPTNAFGQIEFQGGPHPHKAQYVRLNFDTEPAYIMSLFEHVWQITPPRLIITIHGGTSDFDLQAKLAKVFRKGLLKAASTTGAWIITSGCDTGVVRHVAAALEGAGSAQRNKIVCIGISPWGLLKKRDDFLGTDKTVSYYPFTSKGRFTVLNNRHSYFLLVDNGTVGRYGAEVILRKRLEMYISQKQKIFGGTRSVPVVCVVLEGGSCTIRSVLDYVTNVPRVPVVVCDGSGRAADLLAFAHQHVTEDGHLPDDVRHQVLDLVEQTFGCNETSAQRLLHELIVSAQHKNLLTIFRLGEKGEHDVDHAILTALLKGQNLSPADQLALALAWNRVDIARSDIFGMGHEWPQAALHNAMMEALIHNRVDFVRLLLENGVNMQKFLTVTRLDELYNTDKGPPNTLYYIIRDVVHIKSGYRYKLPDIGLVIEKLMGNAYQSTYTTPEFREKYKLRIKKIKAQKKAYNRASHGGSAIISRQSTEALFSASYGNDDTVCEPFNVSAVSGSRALSNHILWRSAFRTNPNGQMRPPNLDESRDGHSEIEEELSMTGGSVDTEPDFRYPFSELMIWAVLTKRQNMAMCMWQHGEEALAKSLVACRLYKSLATEAAEDYLEVEVCEELKKYAEEFRVLSLDLLDFCYHRDDAQTLQLLTYELSNWSNETCLALSVIVNNKNFLAHPCCQILLADLWHGGLRMRTHSNFKVMLGLVFPLFIMSLEFKTREELLNQPQTAAEHEHEMNKSDSSSSASSSSDSSSSSSSNDSSDDEDEMYGGAKRRKQSTGSIQSLNIASLFHSRRKGHGKRRIGPTNDTDLSGNECGKEKEYGTFGGELSPPPYASNNIHKRNRHSSYRKSNGSKSSIGFGSNNTINKLPSTNKTISDHAKPGILEQYQGTRQIKFRRRLYEFYTSPITTFWSWSISFALFIIGLTYVLLVKTPLHPTVFEWILFAYVVGFGMELLRKMLMSESKKITEKIKSFCFNYWNMVTMAAIVFYIIGFAVRSLVDVPYGRVILACDSVLWTLKLLDYMSVHPRLGPYVTMAGKMILNMSYIIVMLVVALLSFGLARQSITYPDENWHWILVRNIFLKPYFMLYGEVYADEIDTCGDEAWDRHLENGEEIRLSNSTTGLACVTGYWIPPLLMTFFLLIANILLMSMLIAIFNHIFDQTDEISQQIWLFQRYRQVMEYESTPFLPPPFTPLYHLYMLGRYIQYKTSKDEKKKIERKRALFDYSLKLFLNKDQIEKLHDFEEDSMEDLARKKENMEYNSKEKRMYRTDTRTDQILNRLVDLQAKETMGRETINDIETRMATLEKTNSEILDCVRQLLQQNLPMGPRCYSPIPEQIHLLKIPEQREESQLADIAITPMRRARTSTVCGIVGEEGLYLSPGAAEQNRLISVSSMDPLPLGITKATSIRRRHEEYTSITDSIAIRKHERRRRTARSNSSDHAESAAGSDIDENVITLSKKRSIRDVRASASRDNIDDDDEESRETNKSFESNEKHDEAAQADCELTDVVSEDEDEIEYDEEEEEDDDEDMPNNRKITARRMPSNTLSTIPSQSELSHHVINETHSSPPPSPAK